MNHFPITVWRKIVSTQIYWVKNTRNGRSITLNLDCGHQDRRKYSKAPTSNRIRCKTCEGLARGNRIYQGGYIETWDPETSMPMKTLGSFPEP